MDRLKKEHKTHNSQLTEHISSIEQKLKAKEQADDERLEPLHTKLKSMEIERDTALENIKSIVQSKKLAADAHNREKEQLNEVISRLIKDKQDLILQRETFHQSQGDYSHRESDFYTSSADLRSSRGNELFVNKIILVFSVIQVTKIVPFTAPINRLVL